MSAVEQLLVLDVQHVLVLLVLVAALFACPVISADAAGSQR